MQVYKLVDLGTLDGAVPMAEAINDAGIVVGSIGSHAMRYDGNLEVLPISPDAIQSTAYRVSNRNPELIVGFRVESVPSEEGERSVATMWRDGQYVDLNALLNASRSGANDVSDDGIVVGWADGMGFRFNSHTNQVVILVAGSANAINARGNIAGITSAPIRPLTRAYLYDGTVNLLPTLGGDLYPAPIGINDDDIVVGTSEADHAERHAFHYDHNTQEITDIHNPGFSESQAWSVNNQNEVVGYAQESGLDFGVIWRPGETMQKLIDLVIDTPGGLSITRAHDINNKGQIVVSGKIGDEERSFLLTPVSEQQ